jgi:Asp-tRNA(Asn)/Glu-tRNA(Gln) amidotransferase B subunit
VARYLEGKTGLAEFFVGRVLARSSGRAAPHRVRELLESALEEHRTEPAVSH